MPAKPAAWESLFPKVADLKTVVLISGPEGSGKTHWAIENSPGPHYIIDTEGEHNLHTAKEQDPEVRALALVEELDVSRDSRWFAGRGTMWDSFRQAVSALVVAPSGTVIIDSGTDLVSMVVGQLTIEWDRGDKAFPTMLYGQVYAEISTHIAHLRKQHNVVLTSRVKEVYKDDKGTGRFKTAIWKQAEYIVEHSIQITVAGNERTYHTRRLKQASVPLPDLKWDWLKNGIPNDTIEAAQRSVLIERINKAKIALVTEGGSIAGEYSDEDFHTSRTLIELERALNKITAEFISARDAKRAARSRPSKP